jgi:ribosomal protein S12 methylthiotransferase
VRESRFDRVGVFRYSDEEGTAALGYGEKVSRRVARTRRRQLMAIQREIMREKLAAHVGSTLTVLVDETGARARGRLASQAPEIDGVVFLSGKAKVGEMVQARITGVRDVDLEGEIAG